MSDLHDLLTTTATRIAAFRDTVGDRPVFPRVDLRTLERALGDLPDGPVEARRVVAELADAMEPGIVASAGPRYFGFVVGGALPAATAADLLAVGWDQPAFNSTTSPAATAVESVAGRWLVDLLGLPDHASFGFVTGGQGANTVGLAAARHHVLARAGWDVERDGLIGAPRVRVVATAERHATIDRALRLLGLGTAVLEPVPTDAQGRVVIDELRRVLDAGAPGAPLIVSLQAGNVNTGAFDDFAAAIPLAHQHGAWVHVDGAFGLWAAASPARRHLVAGAEAADSWGTDGHKWLNVPYDSGYAFTAHPEAHAASMAFVAAYLTGHGTGGDRAPSDFVPESSRRSRGFATYAALRELGRSGVADLVERCCQLATRFADRLGAIDGITIPNEVVLNQVLVNFGSAERTDAVVAAVQRSGEAWMGTTTWQGQRYMRLSVSNWSTTEDDVDRTVAAIAAAHREV